MGKYLSIFSAIFITSVRVQAQLLMNAGDSFSYHFDSLPRYLSQIPCCFYMPGAQFQLTLDNGSFTTGDRLVMEIFEGTTAEPAVAQLTFDGAGTPWVSSLHGWQDHEGAIRVTASSGSFVLNGLTIQRNEQYLSGVVDVWQIEVTPVPEPKTYILFIIALVGSACAVRRSRETYPVPGSACDNAH